MNKFISLIAISVIGYFLIIDISWMNQLFGNHVLGYGEDGNPISLNSTIGRVLHLPSLLYILSGWLIAELLLIENKPANERVHPKSNFREIREANQIFRESIDSLENNNIGNQLEGYKKLIASNNVLVKKFLVHKKKGNLDHDFNIEIIKYSRDGIHAQEEKIQHLTFVSSVLPMLGMIGTLAGIMLMVGNFSSTTGAEKSFEDTFTGLGVALLTTLYASLFTVIFMKPRVQKEKNALSLIKNQCDLLSHQGLLLSDLTEGFYFSLKSEEEISEALVREDRLNKQINLNE